MANMNERKGITQLDLQLESTDLIYPKIVIDDSSTIWDGQIDVYSKNKKGNLSKDDLLGRIHVQAKFRSCSKCDKRCNSFDFNVKDLEQYAKEAATLFYLVRYCNGNYKMYYYPFYNVEVKKIMRDLGKTQKTINLKCLEFPISNPKEIYILHKLFLHNQQKQCLSNDSFLSIEDIMKVDSDPRFRMDIPSAKNINDLKTKLLKHHPFIEYMYGNIPIPITRIKEDDTIKIAKEEMYYFSFEGETIRHTFLKHEEDEGVLNVIIDDKIFLYGMTTKDNGRIQFKNSHNLNEQIKLLGTLNNLFKNKTLTFSNDKKNILLPNGLISIDAQTKEYIEGMYELHIKISKLINFFSIEKEIDLSKLDENGYDVILNLYDIFIMGETPEITKLESHIIPLSFCNINLVFVVENTDIRKKFLDFNEKELTICIEEVDYPFYFIIGWAYPKLNYLVAFDNIDEDLLMKTVFIQNLNSMGLDLLNNLALAFIDKFLKLGSKDSLFKSKKILEYIISKNESISFKINLLQAKYYMDNLSTFDKQWLIKLKNTNNDLVIKCGSLLLLEYIDEFELYFNELKPDEQEEFKKYPIYQIYNTKK